MVTFWGVLVVLGVILVGRYGADSRPSGDPTGRDAAWPDQPLRAHTLRDDAELVTVIARRWAAHRTAWDTFDRSLRPWDADV